jgi:hypothetical protein
MMQWTKFKELLILHRMWVLFHLTKTYCIITLCVSHFVCVCVSVCVRLSLCLCLVMCLSLFVCVCLCQCVCVCVWLSLCLCLIMCLSLCVCVCVCMCVSVCLCVCVRLHISVCACIFDSLSLSLWLSECVYYSGFCWGHIQILVFCLEEYFECQHLAKVRLRFVRSCVWWKFSEEAKIARIWMREKNSKP